MPLPPKEIPSPDLRKGLRRILTEVQYKKAEYIITRFGEPAAAIISMEEYKFLQAARQAQQKRSKP
jgi:prevent-host-death family protein